MSIQITAAIASKRFAVCDRCHKKEECFSAVLPRGWNRISIDTGNPVSHDKDDLMGSATVIEETDYCGECSVSMAKNRANFTSAVTNSTPELARLDRVLNRVRTTEIYTEDTLRLVRLEFIAELESK